MSIPEAGPRNQEHFGDKTRGLCVFVKVKRAAGDGKGFVSITIRRELRGVGERRVTSDHKGAVPAFNMQRTGGQGSPKQSARSYVVLGEQ